MVEGGVDGLRDLEGDSAGDRHLAQLAIRDESDPCAVGGEERSRPTLRAGQRARGHFVAALEIELARSRQRTAEHERVAVGRERRLHSQRHSIEVTGRAERGSVSGNGPRLARTQPTPCGERSSQHDHRGERRHEHPPRARIDARHRWRERRIAKRIRKCLCAVETIRRHFLKGFRDGRRDVRRHRLAQLPHRACRVRHDLQDDAWHRRARVRNLTREHLVQHRAQRVDVRAVGDVLVRRRLLGRHVVRRAERHARLRHPSADGCAYRQRNPEVRHHCTTVVQEDVLGLDVPVNHPVLVRVLERIRDLRRDLH